MVYFHVVSVYQLLNAILLRKKRYRDDEACLIIRDILLPKVKNVSTLYEEFEKIVIYMDMWKGKSVEEQENVITGYFNNLFSENNIPLKDGEEIIVGCAHNTFGMYLSISGIHFIFLEDAAGLISRYSILDEINKKQLALKYELICKWGLINAQSDFITKIICDFRAQDENFLFDSNKYIDFCVTKELGELHENERKKIISVFCNIEKITIRPNSLLLLTQHFANLRTLSFEEQTWIYQIFMDYYKGDYYVVIKPHPDDLMFYPLLFPDTEIIKEKFPAEFLPFLTTNVPQMVATISSTSIFSLRSCFARTLEMGTEFEKEYKFTHRYYSALRLMEVLCQNDSPRYLGCNIKMIDSLISQNKFRFKEDKNNSGCSYSDIWCVDQLDGSGWESTEKEGWKQKTVIFLNSNSSYDFCELLGEEKWENIIPVVLKKERCSIKDGTIPVMDLKEEIVYVYTKNPEHRQKIRGFNMSKTLESGNMTLNISSMTKEEEKIKILEGMLEATEKKLEYYIKLVEEKGMDKN